MTIHSMQRLFSYRSDAAMRSRLGSKQLSALAESVSSDPFAKVGQPANTAVVGKKSIRWSGLGEIESSVSAKSLLNCCV